MLSTIPTRPSRRACVAVAALAFAGLGASTAGAAAKPSGSEPLIVRGEGTVTEACDATGCTIGVADGTVRGTVVGTGAYTSNVKLHLTAAFPNGEGGVCAPVDGEVVLGAGSPDRLRLAIDGVSCQDGAGDPRAASFTTVTRFKVVKGTGAYRYARGRGEAVFLEDAADHERMTLVGRIAR